MPKKRARPADVRPTRGSVHSVAQLRDLDREIARKQSEIRAAKAAAREARLRAGANAADRPTRAIDEAAPEDTTPELRGLGPDPEPAEAAPEDTTPELRGLGPEPAEAAPEDTTPELRGLGPEPEPAEAADRATQEENGADAEDGHADLRRPGADLGLAARLETLGAPLLVALEHHSKGAREHAEATASYAFATAVELGFVRTRSEVLRETAVLHEVGQVYVPAAALAEAESGPDEPGTEALEALYEASYWLARGAGIPELICGWLLRTREHYDGSGPEGLMGEAIPIESRIIRAACVCQTALAEPVGAGPQPGF